ncbi:O-antigen ligase family protein [Aquirhabdus parva]|uniref:O-antigen ligase family protein n=1 Tax=Aquirhabdus parva TaxID=2283318 RepID=UPI001D18704C|nr:O-antigen ligase family protein [Aquirhabdus parva]
MLLLWGTPLLAFLAFSGLSSSWVQVPYDEWRLTQVVILLLLSGFALFSTLPKKSILTPQTHRLLSIGILMTFALIIMTVSQAQYPERALADAALYTLLLAGIWAQAMLMKRAPALAPQIAATLALLPLLTVIFLPISIITAVFTHLESVWHQSFSNIRMLDDALLPCLFLLWQRPAWLAYQPTKTHFFNVALTFALSAISILYLIAFWMDGARAGLLTIIMGLGLIGLLRRDQWSSLRLPLFTLVASGLIYALLVRLLPADFAVSVMRTDSSQRTLLWQKALDLWQAHPVLGAGGDHFALAKPWLLNAHPHNLLLQWISEWGFAGLLTLVLFLPIMLNILRHRQTLPAFALAAVAAVCIDAMVSGVLVYPLSQMLGLWSVAWLISLLPNTHQTSTASNSDKKSIASHFQIWQRSFKIVTAWAIVAMLVIHGHDLVCIHCISVDNENAPRFWQFGRALHLEKQHIAPVIDP